MHYCVERQVNKPVDDKKSSETVLDVSACRAHLQTLQLQRLQAHERRRLSALHAVRGAARSVLPRFPRIQRAFLFGSVLRPGALRPSSDVDVAVEGKLSAEEYFDLWRELERAATGWALDLVELDQDSYFAARVRQDGELVYERSNPNPESGLDG
jgi:predicted nucleotidyltransferase